jgi:hypothetical protein
MRFTKRTFWVALGLVCVVLGYYAFVTVKTLGFGDAPAPGFCPAGVWKNITVSAQLFSWDYLNPAANLSQMGIHAAELCESYMSKAYPQGRINLTLKPNQTVVIK